MNIQTIPTAPTTPHATAMTCSQPAARNRRVRLSYPAAMVELALFLCGSANKREVASSLGVCVSTVYRWATEHRTSWMSGHALRSDTRIGERAAFVSQLSARCEQAGLHIDTPSRPNDTDAPTNANCIGVDANRISALCDVAGHSPSDSMVRAKHFIEMNYALPLSCLQMAGEVNMARFTFIKSFTSAFGVSPYQYLLRVRVKKAIELLQHTDASLPTVAGKTGFGCAASMHRAFKRFPGGSAGAVVKVIAPRRHSIVSASTLSSPQE